MNTILMSKSNPAGEKLEDVLVQLQKEIQAKINNIISDESPEAKLVVQNNTKIIEYLGAALALQQTSMTVLENKAPNQGPTGAPRIGK